MTVGEAILELVRKTDPSQAECLRCCAVTRLALIGLAGLDHETMGEGYWLDAEEIEEEVGRLRALHPDLAERFRPHGCPIGSSCGAQALQPAEALA